MENLSLMQVGRTRTARLLSMPDTEKAESDRIPKNYRFSSEVVNRVADEAKTTGRTQTQVIEDAVMHRNQLSPYAYELVSQKMKETGWTFNQVLDWIVVTKLGRAHGTKPRKAAPSSEQPSDAAKAAKKAAGL